MPPTCERPVKPRRTAGGDFDRSFMFAPADCAFPPRDVGGLGATRYRCCHTHTPAYTAMCIRVYNGVVSRTNIDIDDRLVREIIKRYRLASKREAVDLALRRLAGAPLAREEKLGLEGSGWVGDLGEMRRSRLKSR